MARGDYETEPDARPREVLIAAEREGDRAVLAHMTLTASTDLMPRACPTADAVRFALSQSHRVELIFYASDAVGRAALEAVGRLADLGYAVPAILADFRPDGDTSDWQWAVLEDALRLAASRRVRAMAEAPRLGAGSGVIEASGDLEGDDAGRRTELTGIEVLVIDDTQVFIDGLSSAFRSKLKWRVQGATTAEVGIREALSGRYALILVDHDLCEPNWDGIRVVREIRGNGVNAVIVVVTGHPKYEGDEYAIEAIKAGADWHVLKSEPFEKLCRALCMALARGPTLRVYVCGPIKLDRETLCVTVDDKVVDLPKQQLLMLFALMLRRPRVVRHEELCAVAPLEPGPAFKNLHNQVDRLRERLDEAKGGAGAAIQSVSGVGYRITPLTGSLP